LPTQRTAAGRVLAGLSAGGFGAVDIGLRNPQLFGTIESWSGYFKPVLDGPFKDATPAVLAANDPTRLVVAERPLLSKTRFFVSTGPPHSRWAPPSQTIDYARRLRALGLRYTLRVYTSRRGEWRDQLDDGLRWALGLPIAHTQNRRMLGNVLTAIVTPFRDDGSVDFDSFQRLARQLVENGSDGLVVSGTTGESPNLTEDERIDLFRAAIEAVGEEATVVAGTGTYSTAHSVHLTEQAHELGVDGFLVVTPYYNKPPQRGIVAHFAEIARVSDKPIVVYNIPARVVVNIEPETISRLAEIPTVRAVKQANDDLAQAKHIVDTGLDLYAGDDNLVQPFLELGGIGGVCVHTHVVGPQVAAQVKAFLSGDADRAREIHRDLDPVYELLKVQSNPIPIKAALNLLGHGVGGHRLPIPPPTEEEIAAVRGCLERLGLLVAA
jgi:4-hydroxy-tetrahydrodipicolinate synthase